MDRLSFGGPSPPRRQGALSRSLYQLPSWQRRRKLEPELLPVAHMYTAPNKMMDSSKSNDSTNSGLRDATSQNNDEEQDELCPGFRNADAFVKVSEQTKLSLAVKWATWMYAMS